jgi:hypothetical protein
MGSFLGGGSAKKAAKAQARAIREQTRLNVQQANLQAESSAQQMAAAQAQRAAADYAERLLSKPAEQASVSLAPNETVAQDDGLLGRLRTVRDSYRQRRSGSRVGRAAGLNVIQ